MPSFMVSARFLNWRNPLKVIQRFGEQGAFVKRIVHHDVVIRKFSHVIQFVIPQALRGGIPLKKQAVSLYERP